MKTQNKVAYNVQNLIGFNRSMAVALDKAENGSECEDMYFIEKLRKPAEALGYKLTADQEEKTEEIGSGICLNNQTTDNLARYLKQLPKG